MKLLKKLSEDERILASVYSIIVGGALIVAIVVLSVRDISRALSTIIDRYQWTASTLASLFFSR
jgi:hypothetical protein